jgi:hypothetical protein
MSVDFSESLFSANQKIVFHHEWSGKSIEFKAFDLSYSESIINDWEEVALPRRINRSYTWSGVVRTISLGWSMPAFDLEGAKSNLSKCSSLVKMMYPMMDTAGSPTGISVGSSAAAIAGITGGNPVWYLGIMNLVHNENAPRAGTTRDTLLAGFPTSFNFNMIPEDGFIYGLGEDEEQQDAFPQNIKATMSYTALLDDASRFGWDTSGNWDGPTNFPWEEDDFGDPLSDLFGGIF